MFRQSIVKEILGYDPLVSDNACQNRALALIALARKVNKGKALTSDEIIFLDACSLLTMTKSVVRNQFGYIEDEVTDNKKIPAFYFDDGTNVSNNIRNKLLAVKKKEVAEIAVNLVMKKSPLRLDDTLAYYDRSSACIKLCSESIPVLPVYLSAKSLLQYINRKKIPVVINVKRLTEDGGVITKAGETNLCFQDGKIQSVNEIRLASNYEGVLVFDILSFNKTKIRSRPKFLTENDFSEFIENFKQLDFNLIVMLCAVAHDAYQKSIIAEDNDPMTKTVAPIFQPLSSVSLKSCSMTEYRTLIAQATQYGFFKKRLSVDHISVTSSNDCLQRIKEMA